MQGVGWNEKLPALILIMALVCAGLAHAEKMTPEELERFRQVFGGDVFSSKKIINAESLEEGIPYTAFSASSHLGRVFFSAF